MKSTINILFNESTSSPSGKVVSRMYSIFEQRDGLFTPFLRSKIQFPDAKIYYQNSDPLLEECILERNNILTLGKPDKTDIEIHSDSFSPWESIQNISKKTEEDLSLWKDFKKWRNTISPGKSTYSLVGKAKNLYIHPTAILYPGVVLDTSTGPIVIDRDVKISPFTFIEGPCYIGASSSIDNARITGGTILGKNSRIGGEVENSIFQDFSNKHHEGFVGHSYVGSWVNLGALTTTSDLKNNYGIVKVNIEGKSIITGTIKFGSIISDFVKIAIGSFLNTGVCLDIGSNVYQSRVEGYLPPFSWKDITQKYKLNEFLQDTKKIMARRNMVLSQKEELYLSKLYQTTVLH
jgi:glucose-1-phosphate thymidylyltransferase